VISEDQIRARTLEAEQGFQHHGPLVDPALSAAAFTMAYSPLTL